MGYRLSSAVSKSVCDCAGLSAADEGGWAIGLAQLFLNRFVTVQGSPLLRKEGGLYCRLSSAVSELACDCVGLSAADEGGWAIGSAQLYLNQFVTVQGSPLLMKEGEL